MNILRIKEKSINFLEYIIAFLIILDCNSVWHNILGSDKFKLAIISTLIILIIILLMQMEIKINNINKYMIIITILFIYMLIFGLKSVTIEKFNLYLVQFYLLLPLILFYIIISSSVNRSLEICYKISSIMYYLAAISLVLWALCSIFKIIQLNNTVVINWGGVRVIKGFYNLYYETQYTNLLGVSFIRNTGIFTEAPMFSACLSMALLIEVFLNRDINKKKVVILSITILSTMSTSGYIILLICFLYKIFNNKNVKNKYIVLLKLLVAFLVSVFIIYFGMKMFLSKTSTHSYNVRLQRYVSEIAIWRSNLIFGSGFDNNGSGSSNSIGVILADGGIWLGLLYIIPFIKVLFSRNNRLKIFSLGIIWLMITTVFPYSIILFTILVTIYSYRINKNYKIKGDFKNV